VDSELKERSSLKWFILAGLALFILFTRIHTYHEPLEPDITIYAVIAHELLDGRELYSDLWDHKPPAVYIFYAVAEVLAGYGPAAIFMLNVAIAIISLFGVYLAARTICVDPRGGLWAAAFWALLSDNIHMHANQPNTEVFINACMIWGFALLVQADNRMRIARYLGVGALLALASLFKQVVILGAVFFALAHFLFPAQSPANRKRATLQILCMALVGVVAWLAIFGYFALMGRFGAFWDAVFAYNQMYSGDMFSNLYNWIFNWGSPFPGFFKTILPFLVLTLLGLFFGISPPVRNMALFLGLLVSSMLAVALPGMNHPHYYQLLLPPLSVGAGLGVGLFYKRGARNYAWLVHCFGIFILAIMLLNKLPLYSMPGESWSRIKYGDLYIESYELGRDLDVILQPDETFYA